MMTEKKVLEKELEWERLLREQELKKKEKEITEHKKQLESVRKQLERDMQKPQALPEVQQSNKTGLHFTHNKLIFLFVKLIQEEMTEDDEQSLEMLSLEALSHVCP